MGSLHGTARVPAPQRIEHRRAAAADEHALAELAVVTVAANNHKTQRLDDNGNAVSVVLRDSAPILRARRGRRQRTSQTTHSGSDQVRDPVLQSALVNHSASGSYSKRASSQSYGTHWAKRRRMDRDQAAIEDALLVASYRARRDAQVLTPVCSLDGAADSRFAAILARVQAKAPAPSAPHAFSERL